MQFYFQNWLGALHTLGAVLALVFGAMLLLNVKGAIRHKKIAYVYAVALLILNISSIPIMNLLGAEGHFIIYRGKFICNRLLRDLPL